MRPVSTLRKSATAIARNMRDMLHRMAMTEQDVRTFQGALKAVTRAMKD